MAYDDQDDPYATGELPAHRRGEPGHQSQIMMRRVVALGIGVLILVLLVLAVRGCLDARKERGLENYVSDLNSVIGQSNQVSEEFFGRLGDPPQNISELDFETEVNADAGSAEGLVNQIEGLDVPGELEDSQDELLLAFRLRRDGLSGISQEISAALGEDRAAANERIAEYMRYFLASDVLFERARAEIQDVLAVEEIAEKVSSSAFLPDPVERWLDPVQIGSTLTAVSGGDETAGGVHGLALAQTTVKPGNVVLDPGAPVTVSGGGSFAIEVQAENQGDSEETDVIVEYELTGGAETISGEGSIDSIEAGGVEQASLEISPEPELGTELSLEVTVVPVPEEQISDNNIATYPVIFE